MKTDKEIVHYITTRTMYGGLEWERVEKNHKFELYVVRYQIDKDKFLSLRLFVNMYNGKALYNNIVLEIYYITKRNVDIIKKIRSKDIEYLVDLYEII